MREDSRAIKVTALRPLNRGDYTADEMGVYELLVPHMHRAIAIHRRAVDDQALLRGACAALDSITTGVILLGNDGSIAHCNTAALALLHRSGKVRIRRRRLAFVGTGLQGRYESALHECARLARIDASSDTRSSFDAHFGPFDGIRFTLAPIRADDAWQYGGDICAAVFLTTDQRPMLDLETVRLLYGLTTAEARLAVHLAHGLTLDAYAEQRHLTRNTVVSQLKSVLRKMGARGQADVVRLL